ncbi:non-ribosomal peptide synthetase [Nocardia salmonicida]|uniref:non-ribosomal peptide synthetase n=1 Tax=Nocardia salmonicida TaxID=53431 RepID=UPI0013F4D3E8|nr:amino acid adenylation domain-containing protein [Nocardia salmonicida]
MLERYYTATSVNNLCTGIRISGEFNQKRLEQALNYSILKYGALRDIYCVRGGELWKTNIDSDNLQFPIKIRVLRVNDDHHRRDAEIQFVNESFDIDGELLIRAAVIISNEESTLLIVVHHLNFDATSAEVLLNDVVEQYNASAGNVSTPNVEPSPRYTPAVSSASSIRYWDSAVDKLAGHSLDLTYGTPSGRPGPRSIRASELNWELSEAHRNAIRDLRVALRTTEPIVLLGLYAVLLSLHKQGSTVLVGMPVDIRPPRYRASIGNHVNLLPIVADIDPNQSFGELCLEIQRTVIAGMSHSDHAVDLSLGESSRERGVSYAYNYVRFEDERNIAIGDCVGTKVLIRNTDSRFDLELVCIENGDRRTFQMKYQLGKFSENQISQLFTRFKALTEYACRNPNAPIGDFIALTESESYIVDQWNSTSRSLLFTNVADQIASIVDRHSDRVAVIDGSSHLTYGELWKKSLHICQQLKDLGATQGQVVALLQPRGIDLVCSVIGVLMLGAVYLPIDPNESDERIADKIRIADAKFAIAHDGPHSIEGASEYSVTHPNSSASVNVSGEGNIAYMIFTSGSTGAPKAVRIEKASLANVVAYFQRILALEANDTVAWSTTFGFDISTLELFLPLVAGGRLCVIRDEQRSSSEQFIEALKTNNVTVLQGTPTMLRRLIPEQADLRGVSILCGGESLSHITASALARTGGALYNVYGPTETTIWSSCNKISEVVHGESPHIGTPIDNTTIHVSDEHGREVPFGAIGEILIGGVGVAVDYYRDPERTRDKFVSLMHRSRQYRTGDLGRRLPDGSVEILGRSDRQVKLSGVRIELGEIEAAISDLGLREYAVVAVGDENSGKTLAICVQGMPSEGLRSRVRAQIEGSLPPACHTARIEFFDTLPTTSNGKLDAKSLELQLAKDSSVGDKIGTDLEVLNYVLDWFREIFVDQEISVESNYFDLGGNSLMGARLLQVLNDDWGVELNLGDLADLRTVGAIAFAIESSQA